MNNFEQEKKSLIDAVESKLPEFVKAVEHAVASKISLILQHQDAFAADYQPEEYLLLGMAVKYAGLFGVQMMFSGTNRETVNEK